MKNILIGLVLCGVALAQQQQTVFQTVGTGIVAAGPLPLLKNIGQNFHSVNVVASNSGGVCAGADGTFELEGSFNNSTWIVFRSVSNVNTSGTANNLTYVFSAQGSYPYLRINVKSLGTNCQLAIYYSANVAGPTDSSNYSIRNDTFLYVRGVGAAATNTFISQCPAQTMPSFYGGVIINQGTSALAANARIYMVDSVTADTDDILMLQGLAAGATLVMPQGPRPYGAWQPDTEAVKDIVLFPGAGTNAVSYTLVFRCE